MPIYEYRCRGCGHVFEAYQKIGADGTELKCPQCAASAPDKIFSTIAATNKSGSGGYTSGASGCGSGGFS